MANSYNGTYRWFATVEEAILHAGLNRKQAKRIQKKILDAKDISALPVSIGLINRSVGDAVQTALDQTKGEPEKAVWQWLYRIAAAVGIVAGLNTISSDYNIDAAIEWLKSQNADVFQHEPNKQADKEPVEKPSEDDDASFR